MGVEGVGWGSAIASLMFIWAVARQYFPYGPLYMYFHKYIDKVWRFFYPYIEISFHEYTGERMRRSEVYATIQIYLSSSAAQQAKRLVAADDANKDRKHGLVLSLDDFEQVTDDFDGAKFWWTSQHKKTQKSIVSWYPSQEEPRYYRLTLHRRHRHLVDDYLRYVRDRGKEIEVSSRQRKLFTNNPSSNWGYKRSVWSHMVFEHPATFDTLAMEPGKKKEILQDLDRFRMGKDFYRKIGKPWKRGYLLYGPPGTGKSTMIAAMANHLDYDIYDLELTAIKDNTELRKLLIETTPKSLIVIEDIDCSEDLSGKRKKIATEKAQDNESGQNPLLSPGMRKEEDNKISKVTLSGLLNFIDGLWSSCGGERLIVFTTNYVEKLDPALIRRGRMDKHIELSYCCFETFKVLAKNYLGVDSGNPFFETVRELLGKCKITPADVAENLMPKSYISEEAEENTQQCLQGLIEALKEEAVIQAEEISKKEGEEKEGEEMAEGNEKTEEKENEKTEEKENEKEESRKDISNGI